MAKKSTRGRKSATDRPVTAAERNRAIKFLQKHGGAHVSMPVNGLIQDTPVGTIERCRHVVAWIARTGHPYGGCARPIAEADILHIVVDALEHAEKVIRDIGAPPEAHAVGDAHA